MPRKEVNNFAEIMEQKLQVNDSKGGWDDCTFEYLFERLIEEAAEIVIARRKGCSIDGECADVANFAMMIADNFGESNLIVEK